MSGEQIRTVRLVEFEELKTENQRLKAQLAAADELIEHGNAVSQHDSPANQERWKQARDKYNALRKQNERGK